MSSATLLSRVRTGRHLSQAELARRSGIPRTAINAYESGRRTPTAATLLRLVEACDARIEITPRATVDLKTNSRVLEQVLDLAELLPTRPRDTLDFPHLPP
jgi:transcriptional regulator with XRE-family HTH domain